MFADIYDLFTNQFLHHVDNDTILISEVHNVAKTTAEKLNSPDLKTPRSNDFLKSLDSDECQNITAEFCIKEEKHKLTLNSKTTTRKNSLNKVKESCIKAKNEILECMVKNILDQNGNKESLAALMSLFDLSTDEDLEDRKSKLSSLFDMYGINTTHKMEKWLVAR